MWMTAILVAVSCLVGGSKIAKTWALGMTITALIICGLMVDGQCFSDKEPLRNWVNICQLITTDNE